MAAAAQRGRRPDAADLDDVRQARVERRVRHERAGLLEDPMIALRVQLLDPGARLLAQPGSRRCEAGLDQVLLAPGDELAKLVLARSPDRERGERSGHAQARQIEREQRVAVVDERLADAERVPRRADLLGGPGDSLERAARGLERRPRHLAKLLRGLQQEDPVPAVRGDGGDAQGPHRRGDCRLQRPPAVLEPGPPVIRP